MRPETIACDKLNDTSIKVDHHDTSNRNIVLSTVTEENIDLFKVWYKLY